jgi:hypothetical protein
LGKIVLDNALKSDKNAQKTAKIRKKRRKYEKNGLKVQKYRIQTRRGLQNCPDLPAGIARERV